MRMLGQGRPFIMEFVSPKLNMSCRERIADKPLRELIASELVYCHGFKIVNKKFFYSIKDIEISNAKSYSCIVWV